MRLNAGRHPSDDAAVRRPIVLALLSWFAVACGREPTQAADGGGEGGGSTGNFDDELEQSCGPWCMHKTECTPGSTDLETCTASCVEMNSHYASNGEDCRNAVIALYDCLAEAACMDTSVCQDANNTRTMMCGA